MCTFRYDASPSSEELCNPLKTSWHWQLSKAKCTQTVELLPNQEIAARSGLRVSRRRRVSDHLGQIKSLQDANGSWKKKSQLGIPLTQRHASQCIFIALILHAQSACLSVLSCTESAKEVFQTKSYNILCY